MRIHVCGVDVLKEITGSKQIKTESGQIMYMIILWVVVPVWSFSCTKHSEEHTASIFRTKEATIVVKPQILRVK
jgi:hypothetical protein